MSGWDKYEEGDHRLFNNKFFSDTLVYSMARCGTTSITTTLKKYGISSLSGHWLQYRNQRGPAEHPTPHFGFVEQVKERTYMVNARTAKRLVYTMGRVGTSSINKALNDAGQSAFSAHWLQYGKDDGVAEYPALNMDLTNRIKENKKPIKVIIPIREPMARNIAAFWRIMPSKTGLNVTLDKLHEYSIEQLQNLFIENYRITYPDEWFHLEPMDVFNFNPFKSEFPHSLGYKIYNLGESKILIIRLENCEEQLHHALYELLGVKNIHMEKANVYHGDTYGDYGVQKYKEFKATPFPIDFVKKNYALEYAQHFWTNEERQKLIRKWT